MRDVWVVLSKQIDRIVFICYCMSSFGRTLSIKKRIKMNQAIPEDMKDLVESKEREMQKQDNMLYYYYIGEMFTPEQPCPLCNSLSLRIPILQDYQDGNVPDPGINGPITIFVFCCNCKKEILESSMRLILDKWWDAYNNKTEKGPPLSRSVFGNECEAHIDHIVEGQDPSYFPKI